LNYRLINSKSRVLDFGALQGPLGTFLLAVSVFGILLVPRLQHLDSLVTPDEPAWESRSANFYQALASGNFERTYQMVHPGVTVMWIGALAHRLADPGLNQRMGGQITSNRIRQLGDENEPPINRLVDLRRAIVIANSLVVLALFFCLVPMVERWSAAFAVLFVGLDPIHIGYTRLVHVDGLSTNFLIVSLVAYLWHLTRHSSVGLVVSAVAAGLALLTRSVNGILAPVLFLLSLVDLLLTDSHFAAIRHGLVGMVRKLILWGAITAFVFVALWPAVWVAPLSTFRRVVGSGSSLASVPHAQQVLYNGQITDGDPGWTYYPVLLAYRLSPVTLLGLAITAAVMILFPGQVNAVYRRLCLHLTLFAALYILVLSTEPKKLDRYLLPPIVALDLVAALGTITAIAILTSRWTRSSLKPAFGVGTLACGSMLLLQALFAHQSAPYFITSVSPLKGGQTAALQDVSLGWGEGGKAVAEAILDHPQIAESRIRAGAWPRTIDYYLPFTIGKANYARGSSSLATLLSTDYLVVTQPEVQRRLYPDDMLAWFDTLEPAVTVRDHGRVYARIFDLTGAPIPPQFLTADTPTYEWDGRVINVTSSYQEKVAPGAKLRMNLYFKTGGDPLDLLVRVVIADELGRTVVAGQEPLRADGTETGAIAVTTQIEMPDTIPKGRYQILISLQEEGSPALLQAVQSVTHRPAKSPVKIGEVVVAPR
jgi:hypothetical protein